MNQAYGTESFYVAKGFAFRKSLWAYKKTGDKSIYPVVFAIDREGYDHINSSNSKNFANTVTEYIKNDETEFPSQFILATYGFMDDPIWQKVLTLDFKNQNNWTKEDKSAYSEAYLQIERWLDDELSKNAPEIEEDFY